MPIAFRHRDDPAPAMVPMDGFDVRLQCNATVMAQLQNRSEGEIRARYAAGNRAYVATVDGVPAAWGWVATSTATIGELQASFTVSSRDRYLWNFVTLPAFRGRGIYPRLLNGIVNAESVDGEQFWIAYAPENRASGAGIRKAGFELVAELSFDANGLPAVKDIRSGGGATASRLLGLREIEDAVAACWRCARSMAQGDRSCSSSGVCGCDYQQADTPCVA